LDENFRRRHLSVLHFNFFGYKVPAILKDTCAWSKERCLYFKLSGGQELE
jgi:hypothetical protein